VKILRVAETIGWGLNGTVQKDTCVHVAILKLGQRYAAPHRFHHYRLSTNFVGVVLEQMFCQRNFDGGFV